MGSSARVALSAALAVPVAIALFLIMFKLIDRDYQQDDSKARKIADIVVPDKTIETNLKGSEAREGGRSRGATTGSRAHSV